MVYLHSTPEPWCPDRLKGRLSGTVERSVHFFGRTHTEAVEVDLNGIVYGTPCLSFEETSRDGITVVT